MFSWLSSASQGKFLERLLTLRLLFCVMFEPIQGNGYKGCVDLTLRWTHALLKDFRSLLSYKKWSETTFSSKKSDTIYRHASGANNNEVKYWKRSARFYACISFLSSKPSQRTNENLFSFFSRRNKRFSGGKVLICWDNKNSLCFRARLRHKSQALQHMYAKLNLVCTWNSGTAGGVKNSEIFSQQEWLRKKFQQFFN